MSVTRKNFLNRRNPMLNIYLFPAKVQGDNADNTIIEGIDYFENFDVDVIIVARGGGSIEDLMPFNSEQLARRVYACNKPIISAVGHETDFTIIDFVSDLRAPTPSAAAELVTNDLSFSIDSIKDNLTRLDYAINNLYNQSEMNIVNIITGFQPFENKLDILKQKIKGDIKNLLVLADKPYINAYNFVDKKLSILEKLSPIQILKQGYVIATHENKVVSSIDDIVIGQKLEIDFVDGKVNTTVNNVTKINKGER